MFIWLCRRFSYRAPRDRARTPFSHRLHLFCSRHPYDLIF